MEPTVAYIAFGSNLGDRVDTFLRAVKQVDEIDGVRIRMVSQMMETAPVGGPGDQNPYLNAAVEIETTLAPTDLLAALHEVERSLGRARDQEQRWGPRTCDLDILLMADVVLDSEALTIPHPRMHERLFVLRPLAQIAPGAVHPVLGKTVRELLRDLEGGG